jgi:hypothetical protein
MRYHGFDVSDPDTEAIVLPEVALHLDARWFPVVVATWFGVATARAVERYGGWLERMGARAGAADTQVVIVGDTTRLQERPTPEVRVTMAAMIERLTARHPDRFLGGSTIIGDPVMRAVLAMVLALTRRKLDMRPVKDMRQALARTFALLDQAGIPRPQGLDVETFRSPALLR